MAFGLFKDGEELFDAAVEEIKSKQYDKAVKTLAKAIDKDTRNKDLANVYIDFIKLGGALNSSPSYKKLSSSLSMLKNDDFQFGISDFNRTELIAECNAMASCIDARAMPDSDGIAKGESIIKAASGLMTSVGERTLRINEYYSKNRITGTRMATGLMAEGNEILAQTYYWNNPQKAAEHQQTAYNFRRQNGESGQANLDRMKQYSKACTCWICNRQVVGEGLHFMVMPADPSPQQIRDDSKELQASMNEKHDLYVCRACYTAISRRADDISKNYYNQSMNALRETESRLRAEINVLESRVSSLSSQVNMLRH